MRQNQLEFDSPHVQADFSGFPWFSALSLPNSARAARKKLLSAHVSKSFSIMLWKNPPWHVSLVIYLTGYPLE
jgi:hypothetical protein